MKRFQYFITLLLLIVGVTINAEAQNAVTAGSQVTSESDITSGKAYLIYYVGNGSSGYLKDTGSSYTGKNDDNPTESAVYIFTGSPGSWTIRNYYTNKYWGTPTASANTYIGSDTGGSWTLNFQSNGMIDPCCGSYGWNRSGSNVHPWSYSDNHNDYNQFQIYEIEATLTKPVDITSGWYKIKWVDLDSDTNTDYTDANVEGKYVRNYASEVTVDGKNYPLYLASAPTSVDEEVSSLVYFEKDGSSTDRGVDGYLRSANGHFVTPTGAARYTIGDKNYIIYRSSSNTPTYSVITSAYTGTRNSLIPRGKNAMPYIGQSASNKFPATQFYAINPTFLGLQEWKVSINTNEDIKVTYSGSDAKGVTGIYNGGSLFLSSGVTPTDSEFSAPKSNGFTPSFNIDATNHVITVSYVLSSEVYTINNTNTNRGALIYNESNPNYVWSSGKSGTFDASTANSQWVIYPTGTTGQYYLYNVGARKFVVNTGVGTGAGNPWMFSNNAAPVTLAYQSSGTYSGMYKIQAANGRASDGTNNAIMSVSNQKTYPIINYDDAGSYFTISKVTGDASTAATAAYNKLVENQDALTGVPTTSGWYALQIKTAGNNRRVGRFVKIAENEITYSGTDYPLTYTGPVDIHPAINDATYFTYIDVTDGYSSAKWQLPNGKYLVLNSNNKFPTSSTVAATINAGYDGGNYFKSGNYYAVSELSGETYFIWGSTTYKTYNIYPIDLSNAGLTAWKVTITNGSNAAQLICNRSDVSGLTAVYNNGYFFLPSGVTPSESDFSLAEMISCTIDTQAKTITAEIDPSISIKTDGVTVVQGNQTTGKGNAMQALLRIKATPFADFQPTQFSINLTGASNIDNVKVYSTTTDQIHFSGVTPTLLGTTDSPSDGVVNISVTSNSIEAGTTLYYWITADVKDSAPEWGTIDASIQSIAYSNSYGGNTCDLSSIGNPDGEMRIYKQQNFLWTSSQSNTRYYRIPALLKTGVNTLLAFTDDRYASTSDLGGNHKIDVLMKKSTDGGATWGNAVTVAAGDGSTPAGYGYGDAAVAQAANGHIVCLMASGNTSYGNGMLHIGYTKSTDGGATWSSPIDIYGDNTHLTNSHSFQSTFVSSGHGITQTIAQTGRIAFPALGKISGTTNEYVIYSDDNGATWNFSDNYGFTGADESKLVELNDGKLLMSIRCGGFNSSNVARGHNRTTDPDNVESWGTQGTWSDLTANGCNSDLIYYSRFIDGKKDVMLHSVVKAYGSYGGGENYRKDLRLYMSFDEGWTWVEAFQLQPGYAAYSSMQVLDNGDLAILFEDGSIGNMDKQDCYAINYVVISKEMIEAKIDELYTRTLTANLKVVSESTGLNTYGNYSSGWVSTWTSNGNSGLAGLNLDITSPIINKYDSWGGYYNLCIRPTSANTDYVLTLTAPNGYIIDGYSMLVRLGSSGLGQYATMTAANGTTFKPTATGHTPFTVSNINTKSTTITFTSTQAGKDINIANFYIYLRSCTDIKLNNISGTSYATLYQPYAVTLGDDVKAYTVTIDKEKDLALLSELGQTLPAYTPVVLLSATGKTSSIAAYNSNAGNVTIGENALKGILHEQFVNGYVLNAKNDIPGFYKLGSDGTLAANRAYLPANVVTSEVKGFAFAMDDETGIETMHNSQCTIHNDVVYDLTGRRIMNNSLKKGLYIVNGKKVFVR